MVIFILIIKIRSADNWLVIVRYNIVSPVGSTVLFIDLPSCCSHLYPSYDTYALASA